MSGRHEDNQDRLHALLADGALQPLPPDEEQELARLLLSHPSEDALALERTAAAIGLALEDSDLPGMPAPLRARVEADAVRWLARRRGMTLAGGERRVAASASTMSVSGATPPARTVRGPAARERRWAAWAPWFVAAACAVLAITAWQRNHATDAPLDLGALTVARQRFLETAPDVQRVPWADNDAGVVGDVVWSSRQQEGYVRIQGLAANDPAVAQYQIWIQDAARTGEAADRVDGGVFDVPQAAAAAPCELIVPIHPALPVADPGFFAVTRERPGGVIVSDLSDVVLAAPVHG
jgi:hypothetical protein